jgi:hypothetical protein
MKGRVGPTLAVISPGTVSASINLVKSTVKHACFQNLPAP